MVAVRYASNPLSAIAPKSPATASSAEGQGGGQGEGEDAASYEESNQESDQAVASVHHLLSRTVVSEIMTTATSISATDPPATTAGPSSASATPSSSA
jgi:hypothetical protein